MKTIAFMICSLLIVNLTFAQSKKELDEKILQLEEKIKTIENDLSNIKTNLTNTTTTLGLVSKSNIDLEKLVKEQSILIEKLTKQNDSLLVLYKVKKDADFVSNPKNEEDSIIFLIQSYYACKKWEDRLAFVLKPESVKPYMEQFYTDNYKSSTIKKDEISIQGGNYTTNETFKVVLGGSTILYCKKSVDGFKIDWEATTGYNPKSFEEFLSEKSSSPTTFRLYIKIDDYYRSNYNITEKDYYSFNGWSANGTSTGFFMKKSAPGASELKKMVSDGKVHQVIFEAQFKTIQHKDYPGGEIPDTFIFISKFIKGDWSKGDV